jgi:hypothetical protein
VGTGREPRSLNRCARETLLGGTDRGLVRGVEVPAMRIPTLVLLGCACVAVLGCRGVIGSPGESEGGPGPRGPLPPVTCAPDTILVGTAPMRRLSAVEYVNTLRDLFPDVSLDLPELPPDVSANGFENDARSLGPTDLHVARWEEIAFEHGGAVTASTAELNAFLPCSASLGDDASERACGEALVRDFGARAWRRPLDPDEAARFSAFFDEQRRAIDFAAAVQLTVTALLESPSFLYRLELSGAPAAEGRIALDAYEMASRLSYFVWQSMPDVALFEAARSGALLDPAELEAQARRMIEDERARVAVVDFHRQWLELDRILMPEHATRSDGPAPWTASTQAAAREEQARFVEAAIFDEGTLGALFLDRTAEVNASLAALYGVEGPSDDSTWMEVELPASERAGFLTRAGFLASHAHERNASPPLRGVFVMERLLCEALPAPPPGVDLSRPEAPPGEARTNRQLFEQRTASTTCRACHDRIDGFGFGFENYDAAGAYREEEQGLSIDASGNLSGTDVDGPYVGAIELSEALAESETVRACTTRQWLRFAMGRAVEREDTCFAERLVSRFNASGGDVRDLMLGIVTSPEFRQRSVVSE